MNILSLVQTLFDLIFYKEINPHLWLSILKCASMSSKITISKCQNYFARPHFLATNSWKNGRIIGSTNVCEKQFFFDQKHFLYCCLTHLPLVIVGVLYNGFCRLHNRQRKRCRTVGNCVFKHFERSDYFERVEEAPLAKKRFRLSLSNRGYRSISIVFIHAIQRPV